ncbi:MAG: ATP synthase F1 subunit gamma [Peptococcaceae bacterium]|nr:ATP synthase F1 subunit gamma [Peptococcaceae bacterium]
MANAKEIKGRMQSIANTKQITSAMKMVSASKLRRAQKQVGAGRPYQEKLRQVLAQVAASASGELSDPLLEVRPIKHEAFLVIASNKGLAGGFNAHVLREAHRAIKEAQAAGHDVSVIAVGRKVNDYFTKHGITVDTAYLNTADIPNPNDSEYIAKDIRSAYEEEKYDKVSIVYPAFRSVMSQVPTVVPLLPIVADSLTDQDSDSQFAADFIFEPSASAILGQLLPMYLANQVHGCMADAKTGEHGARMTAMTAATDNATELLSKLEISYNRARQAAITNEITEIVAGANALS